MTSNGEPFLKLPGKNRCVIGSCSLLPMMLHCDGKKCARFSSVILTQPNECSAFGQRRRRTEENAVYLSPNQLECCMPPISRNVVSSVTIEDRCFSPRLAAIEHCLSLSGPGQKWWRGSPSERVSNCLRRTRSVISA